MLKYIKVNALLILFVIIGVSCHKDNPASPCTATHPVSAAFTMEETQDFADPEWVYYDSDTAANYLINFKASEDNATYEWHIGAGVYTKQSFTINFSQTTPASVPIMLIVHKSPNKQCFPDDDGIDTVIRTLYFDLSGHPLEGNYQGYMSSNPNDTFTISIKTNVLCPGTKTTLTTWIKNLYRNPSYNTCQLTGYLGTKEFQITGMCDSVAHYPNINTGNILVSNTGITIKYNAYPKGSLQLNNYIFTGKKVK